MGELLCILQGIHLQAMTSLTKSHCEMFMSIQMQF